MYVGHGLCGYADPAGFLSTANGLVHFRLGTCLPCDVTDPKPSGLHAEAVRSCVKHNYSLPAIHLKKRKRCRQVHGETTGSQSNDAACERGSE